MNDRATVTIPTRLVAILGTSAIAALWDVALVGWTLWTGPTAVRVMATMVAFGVAIGCGLTGLVCRKRAAGTLLPSDVDLSVGFRGGQRTVSEAPVASLLSRVARAPRSIRALTPVGRSTSLPLKPPSTPDVASIDKPIWWLL